LWLWGAASQQHDPTLAQRTGRSGAVVSSQYPLKGLARLLGYDWQPAPGSFEEPLLQAFVQTLLALIEHRDVVYVHLQIDATDLVQRQVAMERIDQWLLKPLRERLSRLSAWRLLTVVDDRRSGMLPVVAIGTGVPVQPAAALHGPALDDITNIFKDAAAVAGWFLAVDRVALA
jgi:2,3-bisphosphoglycerate-independent phosphoglycerate mutase